MTKIKNKYKLGSEIIIYNDNQLEDTKKVKIKFIEKVGETLPFQLNEESTKKDITWISEKIRGEVIESYCSHLRKGDIRVFLKRKILAIGVVSTGTYENNNTKNDNIEFVVNDNFLKVNGIEIY